MFRRIIMLALLAAFSIGFVAAQDVVAPPPPDTATKNAVVINSLPQSEIDIPIRMDLRPIFQFANQFIDTLYTSPNYPNDWVMDGCSVRYQYRFVRGPMQFKAVNNVLYVSFSGYYGVRGSTRVCTGIGNTPWTPACSCGFGSEKPRRIDAGFVIQLKVLPDFRLGMVVNSVNPTAVDKCEVCFFGKDITQTVASQLKAELDASIKGFTKQMEQFSLKPYLKIAWDSLQVPYGLPGFGYLSVQPSAIRISQIQLVRDSMFVSVGLSARPELKAAPDMAKKPLPNLTDFKQRSGFRLFIAQNLHYDSLSTLMNTNIAGKEFTAGKGLFKKTVRIDSVRMQGGGRKMFLKVYVSKAAKGVFFLEGIPKWDMLKQELYMDSLDYHIESKQWLVKSASYLLDGTITNKLKDYSRFNFTEKMTEMTTAIAEQMNREVYPGIQSKGYVNRFVLEKIEAAANGLFIQGAAEGKLFLNIEAQQLLKQFLK
ncbi:MAG: DUF4403 family protein [Bacteroidetes bacterium]|uniref:DUF4403 family protein n=1 Tax=Phnomibacter sp. TaxID=2836217 RepID=UPI002FDE4F8D|nr:DUF4403 family protein [Bacteroidota bacterium]